MKVVFILFLVLFLRSVSCGHKKKRKNKESEGTNKEAMKYFHMAEESFQDGMYEEALYFVSKSIKLEKNETTKLLYLWRRGNMYMKTKQLSEAISDFNSAIKIQKMVVVVHDRAVAHSYSGNTKKAISDYSWLINMNPDYASLTPEEDCKTHEGNCAGEFYYQRGVLYYREKKYASSIMDFTTCLELNPKFFEALVERSQAHFQMNNFMETIKDLNSVINMMDVDNPNSIPFFLRGKAHVAIEKWQFALLDFNKAIEFKTMDNYKAQLFFERGYVNYRLTHYNESIDDFTASLKNGARRSKKLSISSLYFYRANSYEELGDYKRAIKDYDRAIKKNPKVDSFYFNKAQVLIQLKEYDEAIQNYNKAIEIKPDSNKPNFYKYRGELYGFLMKYQNACQDLKKALELEEDGKSEDIEKLIKENCIDLIDVTEDEEEDMKKEKRTNTATIDITDEMEELSHDVPIEMIEVEEEDL